jgi:hypothetical protein
MKVTHYTLDTHHIPVDFRADPDGLTDYEALVAAAGFDANAAPAPTIGALAQPWSGHPEGSAVITLPRRSLFAIVESANNTHGQVA